MTVTEIIDSVREEICNDYCKYTNEAMEHLEEDTIFEKCENCPLNKL